MLLFLGTRFNADAKVIQVNIDPVEIGRGRPVDVGIVGDAKAVLQQMLSLVRGKFEPQKETPWLDALREQDLKGQARLRALFALRCDAHSPSAVVQRGA